MGSALSLRLRMIRFELWDAETRKTDESPGSNSPIVLHECGHEPRWQAHHGHMQGERGTAVGHFPDAAALVSQAEKDVRAPHRTAQRRSFFLPLEPPAWCIEMEKWPYNTPSGRHRLTRQARPEKPYRPRAAPCFEKLCFARKAN